MERKYYEINEAACYLHTVTVISHRTQIHVQQAMHALRTRCLVMITVRIRRWKFLATIYHFRGGGVL